MQEHLSMRTELNLHVNEMISFVLHIKAFNSAKKHLKVTTVTVCIFCIAHYFYSSYEPVKKVFYSLYQPSYIFL